MKSIEHYLKPGAIVPVNNETTKALVDALKEAREALAQPSGSVEQEPKCNPHPKAPHGFNRNASHANDRYTCECEGWDAYEAGRLDGIAQEQAMYEVQRLGQEIQPEQEPVAWVEAQRICDIQKVDEAMRAFVENPSNDNAVCLVQEILAASTTPPQRTWVGLTEDEIDYLVQSTPYEDDQLLVEKTEALLKEKNQ